MEKFKEFWNKNTINKLIVLTVLAVIAYFVYIKFIATGSVA